MDNLPADNAAKPPAKRGSAIESVKRGTMKALGKVRTEAGEAIEAAGASVERIHRRVMLVIGGLLLVLLLGAVFRAAGIPSANYALIALLGLGALYALLQPMHLAGVLLVGGGVAAVRDLGSAGSALLGYARLLGRIFLALLIPLLLFALAPGDRSLGSSLPFIVLAPVVVLATWLFGRVAPRLETFVFVALPLAALLIAVSNMLIPERMLAGLGVPAWLRTARPQDAELAAIETAIEKRKNEARAEQLRAIRRKVEAGEPLTAADEAVVADAKRERVTLTAWIDGQLKAIAAGLSRPERAEAAAPPKPVAPAGGSLMLPARLWSVPVAVPAGYRLCFSSNPRAQCHPAGVAPGLWHDVDQCQGVVIDAMRFRTRRRAAEKIYYRFVPAGGTCSLQPEL